MIDTNTPACPMHATVMQQPAFVGLEPHYLHVLIHAILPDL